MKYNLESMLPEKAFSPRGGRGPFSRGMTLEGGGGPSSAPTSSTTVTSNIPEYAEPYVTNMLDLTQKQLFKTDSTGITGFEPYQPYSNNVKDYFAGFSPLQQQAQSDAGAMQQPGQFALGSGLAGSAGIRSLGAAGQYSQDVTNKQRVDAAGKPIFDQTGNPVFDASNTTQSYMSPYQQNVTDFAKQSAVREAQMAQNAQNLGAARQGTYGGARQTLANMERERNLLSNLSNIQTQGSQTAYDKAMQTQQFGAGLGMQGYGQALGAGSALGQLGTAQQGADIARQNQMATMGGQQQALEQNRINQSIQDYSTQQQYPLMQLGFMSNMLRGLPMEGLSRQTYAPQPSYLTQGVGTVGALGSLANVFKGREGGLPEEFESTTGIKSFNAGGSVGNSVEGKLQDMSAGELQSYIKETSSPMARQIAEKVLRDKVGRAGGGIIAFQNRGEVEDKEDPKKVREAYLEAAKIKRNEIPENLRYDPEKIDAQNQLISDVGSQLSRTPAPASTRGAGGQGITENVLKQIANRDFSGIAGVRSDAEPKAAANPNADLPPMPANVKVDDKGRADAAKQDDRPAGIKAAAPSSGIGIKPNTGIAPNIGGIRGPSSADAPFGLEAPVNPDANKSIAQLAAEKEAYMGPNVGAQEERARLMAEKVNAKEEARRATSMRMAEFFAAWGSTPGSTIVAGLNTLRNKIPDFISDEKEETKIRRAIDKDIAELEKIERLEKSGNYDQAAKRKAELSKESLDTWGKKVTAASNKYTADVGLQAASIRAAASGSENKSGFKTIQDAENALDKHLTEGNKIGSQYSTDKAIVKAGKADYEAGKFDETKKKRYEESLKNVKKFEDREKELRDNINYFKQNKGMTTTSSGSSSESSGVDLNNFWKK
jgi:hypothetical protein